jgi:hypothetical protein
VPGGPRGLQNRCRLVSRAGVSSIPTLSANKIPKPELRRPKEIRRAEARNHFTRKRPMTRLSDFGLLSDFDLRAFGFTPLQKGGVRNVA